MERKLALMFANVRKKTDNSLTDNGTDEPTYQIKAESKIIKINSTFLSSAVFTLKGKIDKF